MKNLFRIQFSLVLAFGLLGITPAFANTVSLFTISDNTDGWIVYHADDSKQWVSQECRARLEQAGEVPIASSWPTLEPKVKTSNWMNCDLLTNLIATEVSQTTADEKRFSLFINTDKPEGWVVYNADDTKQWVSPSCRTRLVDAGVTVINSSWPVIGPKATTSNWNNCDQLVAESELEANAETSSSSLGLFVLENRNDGFVIDAKTNTWQWVSPECRTQLEVNGIKTLTHEQNYLRELEQTSSWVACDLLLVQLAETAPTTARPTVPTAPIPPAPSTRPSGANQTVETGKNCIGMNDSFTGPWAGANMAADAMKTSKGPVWNNWSGASIPVNVVVDQNQWPTYADLDTEIFFTIASKGNTLEDFNPWVILPYDQNEGALMMDAPSNGAWNITHADYVSSWENSSGGVKGHTFNFRPTLSRNIDLKLRVNKLSKGEGKNRWHIVPQRYAEQYAAAMKAESFRYIFDTDKYGLNTNFPLLHDNVKDQLKNFCRIRFMTTKNLNDDVSFDGKSINRNTPAMPTFNERDYMPYEWEVWIANHAGNMDIWHTDHVRSWEAYKTGDSYLVDQAQYFAENLKGDLIREYANEIWNGGFNSTKWIENEPTPLPFAEENAHAAFHYAYGLRTYETAKPWIDAFTEKGRRADLDLTVGMQTGVDFFVGHRVKGKGSTDWSDRVDSITGSFYFGQGLKRDHEVYWRPGETISGSYTRILHALNTGGDAYSVVREVHRERREEWKQHNINFSDRLAELGMRDVKIHLYEGASHMVFYRYPIGDGPVVWDANDPEKQRVWSYVEQYLNGPDYTADLNNMFSWWANRSDTGEVMWFAIYGANSEVAPWGYYESSSSPADSSYWRGEGAFVLPYADLNN